LARFISRQPSHAPRPDSPASFLAGAGAISGRGGHDEAVESGSKDSCSTLEEVVPGDHLAGGCCGGVARGALDRLLVGGAKMWIDDWEVPLKADLMTEKDRQRIIHGMVRANDLPKVAYHDYHIDGPTGRVVSGADCGVWGSSRLRHAGCTARAAS
jgi:hypothetical protein